MGIVLKFPAGAFICKRCHDNNPATNKFCRLCGLPLVSGASDELIVNEIKRKQADEVLDRLMNDNDFKQFLMEKLQKPDSKPKA